MFRIEHSESRLAIDAVDHVSILIRATPFPLEKTDALYLETSLAATDARCEGRDVRVVCTGLEAPRRAFAG